MSSSWDGIGGPDMTSGMQAIGSMFFGAQSGPPQEMPVAPGHQGVDVSVSGQSVRVDVDALAEFSGLFLQMRDSGSTECNLVDFPGGAGVFRQLVFSLVSTGPAAGEQSVLQVTDDTISHFLEAAWLLECPRIYDKVVESPYMRSLSSRRKVELLENMLPFTHASSPTEGQQAQQEQVDRLEEELCRPKDSAADSGLTSVPITATTAAATEEFMRLFLVETQMWQRTEWATTELAKQLDAGDFLLGPRLATGSLRASCELLRLHRRRSEEAGFVSSVLQPVSTLWKNLIDKPLLSRVSWDVHSFALYCMKQRLCDPSLLPSTTSEQELDEQGQLDLPDPVCETTSDSVLRSLEGLLEFIDFSDHRRLQPNWSAILVRMLLLSGRTDDASRAFEDAFPLSVRVQELTWRTPGAPPAPPDSLPSSVVPASWLVLGSVAGHLEASQALLRVLQGYRTMPAEQLCDLLEDVLLSKFLPSTPHCAPVVLASSLLDELVGACFDAGRKARLPRVDGVMPRLSPELSKTDTGDSASATHGLRCPPHWAGQHVLWRLHSVGVRLFEAAFVSQRGFLPHEWPDTLRYGRDGIGQAGEVLGEVPVGDVPPLTAEEQPCRQEPLVIPIFGQCLWDDDLLTTDLLVPVMEAGRLATHEPILHLGRQVIMRHLWRGCAEGRYCEISRLRSLWGLSCLPLCEDASLIREALEYLKGTAKDLQSPEPSCGPWSLEAEDSLFQMFAALDLSRLQQAALLSPYVPPQITTVRLLVQQQPADLFHDELRQEVRSATDSLKSIQTQCIRLSNKLNIVEQRTVINKSQINDAILAIQEHQKKKREAPAQTRGAPGIQQ